MAKQFKVGETYRVWWNVNGGNDARVLEVVPYTGRYPDMFSHVLKLEAPNTKRGWLEMAVRA